MTHAMKTVGRVVDGEPLRMPASPVPEVEGPNGETLYKDDYEPFVEVADWDADGDDDLLIGGYVTGRVFWYENTGRNAAGHRSGFSSATCGRWQAARRGLVRKSYRRRYRRRWRSRSHCGDWRKWGNESPPEIAEDFLTYYENVGVRKAPVLTMKPLPRIGEFPTKSSLADSGRLGWGW